MNQENFYQDYQDKTIQKLVYPEKLDFILSETGHNKKVLDIGCNDGFYGQRLMSNGNQAWGIDIVPEDLVKARAKGMTVKLANIEKEEIPFKVKFDVVILGDVIEHVFDTDAIIDKIAKVLKKGGKFIITTPNVASIGRRLMLLLGKSPFLEHSVKMTTSGLPSVGHIRYYTVETLRQQLEIHHFSDVHIIGDKLNIGVFQSRTLGRRFPNLSIMLMCSAIKR